jgi:hypothetical protein
VPLLPVLLLVPLLLVPLLLVPLLLVPLLLVLAPPLPSSTVALPPQAISAARTHENVLCMSQPYHLTPTGRAPVD